MKSLVAAVAVLVAPRIGMNRTGNVGERMT